MPKELHTAADTSRPRAARMRADELPRWVEAIALPLVNLMLALLAAAGLIALLGESPLAAGKVLIEGALGSAEGWGYTLFYATNFVFTGLAVAVAFQAGLFNIGAEGQAALGGIGAALVALSLGPHAHAVWVIPACIVGAATLAGAWGAIPGYLQAWRGSHVVITTIMFNFIASALLVYLLTQVLIEPGAMAPQSAEFAHSSHLPSLHAGINKVGEFLGHTWDWPATPLNVSLLIALAFTVLYGALTWRSRFGYAMRVVGSAPDAAGYAGIDSRRAIVITMAISGALAGMVSLNELLGSQHRLVLGFTAGYGFTGIAVALMGRNHPVGIVLASLLFGALYQGGAELSFSFANLTREMVVTLQGLVILFAGALSHLARKPVEAAALWLLSRLPRQDAAPSTEQAS
jgi:ABC-type uncharacterized transport system permease subunit